MATMISKATGNFTAAGTWSPISDVAAAELDSEAGNTVSTTAYVYSATFTPAGTAVDGVAIKVAARVAGSVGTISIILANNTTPGSNERTVTLNVSNLPTNTNTNVGNGWIFFKFASTVIPNGTDAYKIGFKTSTSGEVTLYRNATAGNWSRMVRLTSAGSIPVTDDKPMVMGEWVAGGPDVLTSFVVTMDETATTSYGPTVSGGPPQGMTVSQGGTLQYGVAAGTNYYLRLKGVLAVWNGGTLNIGTSGTPMPSTSSAVLEFASVANVDSGLELRDGAVCNIYGNTVTAVQTLMTADKIATNTIIAVASTAGWVAGDVLCFASTSQTANQTENKTILTVDSAVQVTLTAGLTNAHSGTNPTQAEVGNLTRNVKIRGLSTTLCGYVSCGNSQSTGPTATWRYAEFYQLGSGTTNKLGVQFGPYIGLDIQFCTFHDPCTAATATMLTFTPNTTTMTFSSNVLYGNNTANCRPLVVVGSGGLAATTFDSNLVMGFVYAPGGLQFTAAAKITITNNHFTGLTAGQFLQLQDSVNAFGTFSGNVIHSCTGNINVSSIGGTLGSTQVWRCNNANGILYCSYSSVTIDSWTMFGNANSHILTAGTIGPVKLIASNCVFSGDSTFATKSALLIQDQAFAAECVFDTCTFGVATGIKVAHSTGDIVFQGTSYGSIILRNCTLSSGTQISGQTTMNVGSYVSAQRLATTAGNHKTWMRYGTITSDSVIVQTAPLSERMTPNNASNKLESGFPNRGSFRMAVANGATATVTAGVRKSVVGDAGGATYNGNQPRLMVRKNVAAGITADTVLATATNAANGAFETESGTTIAVTDDSILEFFVDCDGTAGWINVGTWTAAVSGNTAIEQFWEDGLPANAVGATGGGSGAIAFL